ncbi:hypothetical protein AALO_G00266990 [Alosa alosa]|uniref:Small monomeric GTPase n=1 Tax=Alosa alosa TaxID=278164 RepID=A0AAV6FL84_9TELE|nr:hypothetical protein AALO_G00266990 [Alosa alosa]
MGFTPLMLCPLCFCSHMTQRKSAAGRDIRTPLLLAVCGSRGSPRSNGKVLGCGRFKKEIVVDGQSYLLLIRDEGGPPEAQFALWVDAVIFVFSLEDEISFQTVYHYYSRMANYRNTAEVPLVLVGTQDAISSANPRVIEDTRARKLSNDLKRCTYHETCATYGLNVERVFQDGKRPRGPILTLKVLDISWH